MTSLVRIPDEFKQFVSVLDDYSMPTPFEEREWIARSFQGKNIQSCRVVATFLRTILGQNVPGVELRRIWDAGWPVYMFETDEQLRLFLTTMLEELEGKIRGR